MAFSFYETLGQRLRSYRKAKHLTLKDLSTALNKSLATVGKYETGEIVPDLETIVSWCRYLNVDLGSLLPSTYTLQDNNYITRYRNHFIDRLYLYYFKGGENKIHTCVIENDNLTLKSTLYYDVRSIEKIYQAPFIYNGSVRYSDTSTSFIFFNGAPPFDMLTFNMPFIQDNQGYRLGPLTTITFLHQKAAIKALASEHPVTDTALLCDILQLSATDIRDIRKTNFFII